MNDVICTMAAALAKAEEQEQTLLELLCRSEEKRLEQLTGYAAEECREALLCAAAFFAAAALADSRAGSGETESFRVGDVSVKTGKGGDTLRKAGERLLASCGIGSDGFVFREVRG